MQKKAKIKDLTPLFLAFTLLVIPAVRAQEDVPEVARSLMEEAEHARESGRPDEAISKYKRVLEVAPALASAYANLGTVYYSQGKVDEAYRTFVRGVEQAGADRTLLSNAAATAQQLGKSAEALTYVDRALEKNARDASLFVLRGTVLRSLQRNEDALAAFQQAAQLSPDDAKVQFSLGNTFYVTGRRDEAIAAYRRAVELDRNYLRAYYNLGAVLFEAGRYDEALQAYKMALAPIEQAFARRENVDPINARAYENLGAIYLGQKQWQQATDAYQKALRLDPNSAAAHYNLGFIDFSTGKLDRAEEEYRKALARDPALPLAYLHLGEIAYKRGEMDKAIQLLREGMPRFDRDAHLRATRLVGHAQFARGDRAGARAAFEEVIHDDPNDSETLLYLARIARLDQRPQDALTLLSRAQPNAQTSVERVLAARDAGDLNEERNAIEAALSHGADSSALRAELVVVLLRQNAIDDARRALSATNDPALDRLRAVLAGRNEARDASANTPLGRGNLGLQLWQSGRASDARAHLAAAHTVYPDWNEVTVALAEIAISDRRFGEAANLLSGVKCDATAAPAVTGRTLQMTIGRSDDLCARVRRDTATALLGQAAEELVSGSPRNARAIVDRATSMSLDNRQEAIALFLRGTAELMSGGDSSAVREALTRATSLGLPPAVEQAARRNLEAAQPIAPPVETKPEPVVSQSRTTVVVFLPDAPVESDKRLAEAVGTLVSQMATLSNLPLHVEFFRRAEDARAFVAANRDRVGIVLSNPEFIASLNGDLTPHFQFVHEGRQTYKRVIVVPAGSAVRGLSDLRNRTISTIDVLNDAGVGTPVRVPDDLTAIANVLFGKSDAAFVSEANPLLAQRGQELRVVYSTAPQPLPVIAFAPMPESDRKALDDALRALSGARAILAPLQVTALAAVQRETPTVETRREAATVSPAALGLRPPDPPTSVAYRVSVDLPRIDIPEPKLGSGL